MALAIWPFAGAHADGDSRIMPAREMGFRVEMHDESVRLDKTATLWAQGWIGPLHEFSPAGPAASIHGSTPVNRYRWNRGGFFFVPDSDGWATLSFHSEISIENSTRFEGPIALRRLFATDSSLSVRSFESEAGNNSPAEEKTPLSSALQESAMIVPAGGSASARLRLKANQPVIVRFSARAVAPKGYRPMPRLPSYGTPAHAAVQHFRRGVNLGNNLEAPPDEDWGAQYSAADFDAIQAEGFDHVRIPVAWHHHTGPPPEYKIDQEFFERVAQKAGKAAERNLAVILNWQHFHEFTDAPDRHIGHFERVWLQIARRCANFPGRIAFELLNEPHHAASTLAMNRVYEQVLPALRAEAPDITLFVSAGDWSRAGELPILRLPATDSNLVVAVHHYDPFPFTHQGAEWAQPAAELTGIHFPGPGDAPLQADPDAPADPGRQNWLNAYNYLPTHWNPCSLVALGKPLRLAKAWSDYYGRPVHIGEWGCIATAPAPSRASYYKGLRILLEETDLPWAIWDWAAHFRYWDQTKERPLPGLRPALFPETESTR